MYDMYIAEAIIDNEYQEYNLPEKKEALINQVLKKHKISEARWDTSLLWYSDNIDQYLQINDSVKARLKRNQDVVEKLNLQLTQANSRKRFEPKPDNYIPQNLHIAGLGCDRGFKFKLDSLQLTEKFVDTDTIFFSLKVLGAFPHNSNSLKSMLTIKYADTTLYQTSKLEENKSYSFPILKHIEQDTIISLNGFVNLSGKMSPIPIQLYQISLGKNNNDTTLSVNDLSDNMFLDNTRMTKE